jgi:hypothetical protein
MNASKVRDIRCYCDSEVQDMRRCSEASCTTRVVEIMRGSLRGWEKGEMFNLMGELRANAHEHRPSPQAPSANRAILEPESTTFSIRNILSRQLVPHRLLFDQCAPVHVSLGQRGKTAI